MAAVTYDGREVLRQFAQRRGITYPLLADEGSKAIRAFGIFNETIVEGSFGYGVPHPGVYVIDERGVVRSKYFEEKYQERYTAGAILVREFPVAGTAAGREIETRHLKLRAWTSDASVVPGSRLSLVLEVEMPKKMHVYAPGVAGYIPVDWKLAESSAWRAHEAAYPPSRRRKLKAIGETAEVYEGRVRLTREVTIGQPPALAPLLAGGQELKIAGSFRYQACDDKVCYLPQTVPLEWTVTILPYDRQRTPGAAR